MRGIFRAVAISLLASASLSAHDLITTNLTYSREISRILARRCVACHGPGATISLTSYQNVRPWAVDIKEQVLSRSMPPWGAVKGFGNFDPDEALTQEEILIIASWVVGGAPQGDAAVLPKEQPKEATSSRSAAREEMIVADHTVLEQTVDAVGVRPMTEGMVASARVIAHLPNGRIQPLVWLFGFDPKWQRAFLFRQPLRLEKGTVIESSPPLRFALQVAVPATALSQAR